ncbi:MAG: hypothetical protein Q4A44_03570 [Bacteroidales bacterium]|nr:hypothetical protein [Bacteroidales bacterium]
MKKNLFKTTLLALLLAAAPSVFAQNDPLATKPLSAELQAKAERVISLNTQDPDKANKEVVALVKKYKQEDLAALGRFFMEQEQPQMAVFIANQVYRMAPTYLPGLSLRGDVYAKMGAMDRAGQMYDAIVQQMPDETRTLQKIVTTYWDINPEVAKETLLKIKESDPQNVEADRQLAALYFKENDSENSLKHGKVYLAAKPNGDETTVQNQAILLFATDKTDELLLLVAEGLKKWPQNLPLNRMNFYAKMVSGNYEEATVAAETFFKLRHDTAYNHLDYNFLGQLNDELGKEDESLAAYERAVKIKPDYEDGYAQLYRAYQRAKMYDKAIEAYGKLMALKGDKAGVRDLNSFAILYYNAAANSEDAATKETYLVHAVEKFKKVAELNPTASTPIVFLARIESLRANNEVSETAYTYYKQAADMLDKEEGQTYNRVEAYNYISYYALQKNDLATARAYNAKAIAVDAENELAQQIAGVLKKLK